VIQTGTTVGQVRQWQGRGGPAARAPTTIRKFAAESARTALAAWCWVATGPGQYEIYLVDPAGSTRHIGSFGGLTQTPTGTPTWD